MTMTSTNPIVRNALVAANAAGGSAEATKEYNRLVRLLKYLYQKYKSGNESQADVMEYQEADRLIKGYLKDPDFTPQQKDGLKKAIKPIDDLLEYWATH